MRFPPSDSAHGTEACLARVGRHDGSMHLSPRDLARHIDHTLLKPDATSDQIRTLCAEAREHEFWSVCVNGSHVALASSLLEDTDIKVAAVVGFPLGASGPDVKRFETECAIDLGA